MIGAKLGKYDSNLQKPSRVRLDFEKDSSHKFTIEELTLSPFIQLDSRRNSSGNCEVWMELSIRNTGSNSKPIAVPTVSLSSDSKIDPSCELDEDDLGKQQEERSDLNFVMYSDIWYSFVKDRKNNHDFMLTGYNTPVRVIDVIGRKTSEGLRDITDQWITGDNDYFRVGRFQHDCALLRNRILTFHNFLKVHSCRCFDALPELEIDQSKIIISRINEPIQFGNTVFDIGSSGLGGRFAFRRRPWLPSKSAAKQYNTGYGGTAVVTKGSNLNEYLFHPQLFGIMDSKKQPAMLMGGEAIRFWLRWRTNDVAIQDEINGKLHFSMQLDVVPRLESFNTFLRLPTKFEQVIGGFTDFKSYQVPPRLFFIWVRPIKHRCLAYSELFERNAVSLDLSASFADRDWQQNRILETVLLTSLLGIVTGFGTQAMFEKLEHNSIWGMLHPASSSTIVSGFLILATIAVYKEVKIRFNLLVLTCILSFGVIEVSEHGWLPSISMWFILVTLSIFAFRVDAVLLPTIQRKWSKFSFEPNFIKRIRFAKKILGGNIK